MDQEGFSNLGFATTQVGDLFKTTDGGFTWKQVLLYPIGELADIAFKDSSTGWITIKYLWSDSLLPRDGYTGCFKTTDGGETWNPLPLPIMGCNSIYFNEKNDGLFISIWGFGDQAISWDEGLTWATTDPRYNGQNGYSFFDIDTGILSGATYNWIQPGTFWLRTEDGGRSWYSLQSIDECWQPLAIGGTKTGFAISDRYGAVYRTDDMWNSWKTFFTFPEDSDHGGANSSGTIRGNLEQLFATVKSGCYTSLDSGKTWKYFCGVHTDIIGDTRFYLDSNLLFLPTFDSVTSTAILWRLNLDSMQYFQTSLAFADGSKRMAVLPGTTVTINYSPQTSDAVGIDTGHLVFHYDTNSLVLKSWKVPLSWIILDSITSDGVIELAFTSDSNIAITNPLVSMEFKTYLSSLAAKVYLDTAYLSGKRLNCDCQALSTAAPDSVELDFTGCGNQTILAAMEHQPPFRIESVVPNPASASLRVQGIGYRVQGLQVQLFDALGNCVITEHDPIPDTLTPTPYTLPLDVSGLPSGIYFLRISSGGYAESRSVAIER